MREQEKGEKTPLSGVLDKTKYMQQKGLFKFGAEIAVFAPPLYTIPQADENNDKKGRMPTATCDKAGAPNDVCPYVQVMSASPNDVAYGNDVVPSAQWANITSLRPTGATSLRTK